MPGMDADTMLEFTRSLSRAERHVLMLHWTEELEPAEIALVLDLSLIEIEETIKRLRMKAQAEFQPRRAARSA